MSSVKPELSYLPHLDGLRALAFTYVLLYHFQIPHAQGGYLGVDIFLVLSGFLMTRIILRDLSNKSFSMFKFMQRRFWRLYPSLLVTVALTLCASLLLYIPRLQLRLAKSAAAALLFGSNIYFMRVSGYFDTGAELKPLLHTWSLSLEEQFYFFWPVFLYIVHTRIGTETSKLGLSVAFAFATALSFWIAVRTSYQFSPFRFFSLPCRVFEFAVGAFLSVHYDDVTQALQNAGMQDLVSILGMILVNEPVFFTSLRPTSKLPGPASIPTLAGTCLLMLSPSSAIGRYFLSCAPVRFLGKISYAGYLVHWPLWAFSVFTMYNVNTDGVDVNKPLMFLVTFVLALVLHKTVEKPFRYGRSLLKSVTVFLGIAVTLGLAGASVKTRGFPSRMPQYPFFLGKAWRYNQVPCKPLPNNHPIFAPLKGAPPPEHCYISPPGQRTAAVAKNGSLPISAVLIGSSFGYHLIPAFRLLALQRKESYLILQRSSCPLIADPRHRWLWMTGHCPGENRKRMKILRKLPPQKILLADFWSVRFLGLGNKEKYYTHKTFGGFQYFRGTCKALAKLGHGMTVLGAPPSISETTFRAVVACYDLRFMRVRKWIASILGREVRCGETFLLAKELELQNARFKKFFREDKEVNICAYLEQLPNFCKKNDLEGRLQCRLTVLSMNNAIIPPKVRLDYLVHHTLYFDGAHLNELGSWHASRAFRPLLDSFKTAKTLQSAAKRQWQK